MSSLSVKSTVCFTVEGEFLVFLECLQFIRYVLFPITTLTADAFLFLDVVSSLETSIEDSVVNAAAVVVVSPTLTSDGNSITSDAD